MSDHAAQKYIRYQAKSSKTDLLPSIEGRIKINFIFSIDAHM
jgi:hypothetical protein